MEVLIKRIIGIGLLSFCSGNLWSTEIYEKKETGFEVGAGRQKWFVDASNLLDLLEELNVDDLLKNKYSSLKVLLGGINDINQISALFKRALERDCIPVIFFALQRGLELAEKSNSIFTIKQFDNVGLKEKFRSVVDFFKLHKSSNEDDIEKFEIKILGIFEKECFIEDLETIRFSSPESKENKKLVEKKADNAKKEVFIGLKGYREVLIKFIKQKKIPFEVDDYGAIDNFDIAMEKFKTDRNFIATYCYNNKIDFEGELFKELCEWNNKVRKAFYTFRYCSESEEAFNLFDKKSSLLKNDLELLKTCGTMCYDIGFLCRYPSLIFNKKIDEKKLFLTLFLLHENKSMGTLLMHLNPDDVKKLKKRFPGSFIEQDINNFYSSYRQVYENDLIDAQDILAKPFLDFINGDPVKGLNTYNDNVLNLLLNHVICGIYEYKTLADLFKNAIQMNKYSVASRLLKQIIHLKKNGEIVDSLFDIKEQVFDNFTKIIKDCPDYNSYERGSCRNQYTANIFAVDVIEEFSVRDESGHLVYPLDPFTAELAFGKFNSKKTLINTLEKMRFCNCFSDITSGLNNEEDKKKFIKRMKKYDKKGKHGALIDDIKTGPLDEDALKKAQCSIEVGGSTTCIYPQNIVKELSDNKLLIDKISKLDAENNKDRLMREDLRMVILGITVIQDLKTVLILAVKNNCIPLIAFCMEKYIRNSAYLSKIENNALSKDPVFFKEAVNWFRKTGLGQNFADTMEKFLEKPAAFGEIKINQQEKLNIEQQPFEKKNEINEQHSIAPSLIGLVTDYREPLSFGEICVKIELLSNVKKTKEEKIEALKELISKNALLFFSNVRKNEFKKIIMDLSVDAQDPIYKQLSPVYDLPCKSVFILNNKKYAVENVKEFLSILDDNDAITLINGIKMLDTPEKRLIYSGLYGIFGTIKSKNDFIPVLQKAFEKKCYPIIFFALYGMCCSYDYSEELLKEYKDQLLPILGDIIKFICMDNLMVSKLTDIFTQKNKLGIKIVPFSVIGKYPKILLFIPNNVFLNTWETMRFEGKISDFLKKLDKNDQEVFKEKIKNATSQERSCELIDEFNALAFDFDENPTAELDIKDKKITISAKNIAEQLGGDGGKDMCDVIKGFDTLFEEERLTIVKLQNIIFSIRSIKGLKNILESGLKNKCYPIIALCIEKYLKHEDYLRLAKIWTEDAQFHEAAFFNNIVGWLEKYGCEEKLFSRVKAFLLKNGVQNEIYNNELVIKDPELLLLPGLSAESIFFTLLELKNSKKLDSYVQKLCKNGVSYFEELLSKINGKSGLEGYGDLIKSLNDAKNKGNYGSAPTQEIPKNRSFFLQLYRHISPVVTALSFGISGANFYRVYSPIKQVTYKNIIKTGIFGLFGAINMYFEKKLEKNNYFSAWSSNKKIATLCGGLGCLYMHQFGKSNEKTFSSKSQKKVKSRVNE